LVFGFWFRTGILVRLVNAGAYHGHHVAGVASRTVSRRGIRQAIASYTTLLLTDRYKDFGDREVDWVFDPEHRARKEN
jgi:hypothetical protein